MEAVRLGVTRWIQLPKNVSLSGRTLVWEAEIGGLDERPYPLSENFEWRGIGGCLEAFAQLADASTEKVLEFAQKYGVLGIAPHCMKKGPGNHLIQRDDWKHEVLVFHYTEPVSVYHTLALQVQAMLKVMQTIHAGKTVDQATLVDCFQKSACSIIIEDMLDCKPGREFHIQAYKVLLSAVRQWADIASYQFNEDFAVPPEKFSPRFLLNFGDWYKGSDWDLHFWELSQEIEETDYQHALPEGDLLEDGLPASWQRPSPLFNVLAYQISEAISLPKGTYYCDGCNKWAAPDLGRRKRRPDMNHWYHSLACADTGTKATDRERKRKQSNHEALVPSIDN
jgi:hypothetical protein